MGYNCAIYVEGLSRGDHHEFLEDLEREGVLDDVRSISFTDEETIHIVAYEGAEFLARYGEFPPADRSEANLWVLFEFESGSDGDRLCDREAFAFLADKLPKLDSLRAAIETRTGHDTGAGIYGREPAYDPWGLDSLSTTDPVDRDFGERN